MAGVSGPPGSCLGLQLIFWLRPFTLPGSIHSQNTVDRSCLMRNEDQSKASPHLNIAFPFFWPPSFATLQPLPTRNNEQITHNSQLHTNLSNNNNFISHDSTRRLDRSVAHFRQLPPSASYQADLCAFDHISVTASVLSYYFVHIYGCIFISRDKHVCRISAQGSPAFTKRCNALRDNSPVAAKSSKPPSSEYPCAWS